VWGTQRPLWRLVYSSPVDLVTWRKVILVCFHRMRGFIVAVINFLCTTQIYWLIVVCSVTSPNDSNLTEWLIYVGGEPSERGIVGCLTSVSIDDYQFELVKAATGVPGMVLIILMTLGLHEIMLKRNIYSDQNRTYIANIMMCCLCFWRMHKRGLHHPFQMRVSISPSLILVLNQQS